MEAYIAINGDDVGEKIGQAIASDDHESLAGVTGSISNGLSICKDWAEKSGGEVLSSSGDECLLKVPAEAMDQLEEVKAACEKECGHTMTVGVGESMSEAAKALIYGKMNGKDQVVQYDPSIDAKLSDDEMEEVDEMSDEEMPEDTEEIDVPADEVDGDYGSEKMKDAQPEHEEDMGEEEEFIHDAQENRADELDEDNIEADEEPEESEEGYEEEEQPEGLDGKYDGEEEAPIENEYEEAEEALEEDAMEEDMEAPEEEEYDHNDMLEDMMDANMEEDEMDEEAPEEPPTDAPEEELQNPQMMEEDDDSALKEDIFHALQVFKQNKEMLEQTAEANPVMYQATMGMLRSMIAMAHKLGYSEMGGDDVDQPMPGDDEEAMMMRRMGKSEKFKGKKEKK